MEKWLILGLEQKIYNMFLGISEPQKIKKCSKKEKKKEIGTHQRDRGAKSKSSERPNWNDLSNELK